MASSDPFAAAFAQRQLSLEGQNQTGRSAEGSQAASPEQIRSRILRPAMTRIAEHLHANDAWLSGPVECVGASNARAVKGTMTLPAAGSRPSQNLEISVSTNFVGDRCVNWVIVGRTMRNYEPPAAGFLTTPTEADTQLRTWLDETLDTLILDEINRSA